MKQKMEPTTKRRYVTRTYKTPTLLIHDLFKIPNKEIILDLYWDKEENQLVIKTKDIYDEKKGDL